MTDWVLIPHFYQPPTQSLIVTEQILRSCYLPFLDTLIEHPEVEMSIDLSASLVLQLERIQNHDFFAKIKTLLDRSQIEFLNSAIFHPILPLTPQNVVLRQVKESTTVLERFTGVTPVPGFFPPELAIDQKVFNLLKNNGMDFVIVDESSANPNFDLNKIPDNSVYKLDKSMLLVSSRALSELLRSYPTELRANNLTEFIEKQKTGLLICATDAEVFGHHYSERLGLLKDLFQSNKFKFIKATSAISTPSFRTIRPGRTGPESTWIPGQARDDITASSWQTSQADLKSGVPFAMWNNPKNPLQQKYQLLAEMAYKVLLKTESETTIENISHQVHSAQHYFDQGISSCHSYWLSNTPWWHPDMVELGAGNLIRSIRSLPVPTEEKQQAENFFHNFMMEVWQRHWSGEVEKSYREYDNHRAEILNKLPKI